MIRPLKLLLALTLSLVLPLHAALGAAPAALPDGSHDFDFNFGLWHTHIRLLKNPFAGDAPQWTELNGTVAVRKIWDGKAQLEEIEADGATGHFEGLTLFLYDNNSRQWAMHYAGGSDGALGTPTIGSFKNGVGELYGQDTLDGRSILVRSTWSNIRADRHHFEQALSRDGGKTWVVNFAADLNRTTETPNVPALSSEPAQHGFDWQQGDWDIHMQRMLHPLSGAEKWTTYDGEVRVAKIWNGRANIAEINTTGPSGQLEFLSLRLYNPQTHQWTLNFAHSGSNAVGSPMYGEFKDGRGEFYDSSALDGREILERFVFDNITAGAGRDEQAFSADGGKTWEVNWINQSTRKKNGK